MLGGGRELIEVEGTDGPVRKRVVHTVESLRGRFSRGNREDACFGFRGETGFGQGGLVGELGDFRFGW